MNDDVDFDRAKDAANRLKHGLSLDRFPVFDEEPLVVIDDRFDYGEERLRAIGRIDGRGHNGLRRLITFRRAREKEMRRYGR